MKHPAFTTATVLFMLALFSGAGAVTEHDPALFIFAAVCFLLGCFAAFGASHNNNTNND